MKRRVALIRKKQLRALKAIRRQSAKAKARAAAVRAAKRERVELTGGRCEFPGCRAYGLDPHHVKKVGRGGSDHVSNLRLLCREHHEWVETHDQAAREMGLSLRSWEPETEEAGR